MTARHAVRLAAAAVLVAAAGAVAPLSPAAAETCSSDTGVSVVVDGSGLGGGVVTSCVADGGGDTAGSLFEVHHDLTRTSRFPGVVCRIDGAPADAACQNMPPGDAYWGLFWSDGSGGWIYSSEGVDSLNVPDGGSVAFAWQDGGDQDAPVVAPPQQDQEEPSSSPTPSDGHTGEAGGGGSGGSAGSGGSGGTSGGGSTTGPSRTPSTSPAGSASSGEEVDADEPGEGKPSDGEKKEMDEDRGKKSRGEGHDKGGGEAESAKPSEDVSSTSGAVLTADPPSDAGDDGLPAWVAPVGIAILFGIAGAVALLRRRSMS